MRWASRPSEQSARTTRWQADLVAPPETPPDPAGSLRGSLALMGLGSRARRRRPAPEARAVPPSFATPPSPRQGAHRPPRASRGPLPFSVDRGRPRRPSAPGLGQGTRSAVRLSWGSGLGARARSAGPAFAEDGEPPTTLGGAPEALLGSRARALLPRSLLRRLDRRGLRFKPVASSPGLHRYLRSPPGAPGTEPWQPTQRPPSSGRRRSRASRAPKLTTDASPRRTSPPGPPTRGADASERAAQLSSSGSRPSRPGPSGLLPRACGPSGPRHLGVSMSRRLGRLVRARPSPS